MESATSLQNGHTFVNEMLPGDEEVYGHCPNEVSDGKSNFVGSIYTIEEKNRCVTSATNTRVFKRCSEVSSRVRLAPDSNDDGFDYDNEIRELRSLYKLCGLTIGLFRPQQKVLNDATRLANTTVSNEW